MRVARFFWVKAGSQRGSLMLLGMALLAGARYLSDDLHCPADGQESNHGEAEWSWFPLGTTCHWTEVQNGFDRVDEPGWSPTVLIAVMVVAGLCLVLAPSTPRRRSRTFSPTPP